MDIRILTQPVVSKHLHPWDNVVVFHVCFPRRQQLTCFQEKCHQNKHSGGFGVMVACPFVNTLVAALRCDIMDCISPCDGNKTSCRFVLKMEDFVLNS